jgi:hypothetical protein
MKKRAATKSRSTVFARGVLYLVTIAALIVCFILLPELAREESVGKSDVTVPFLSIAYLLATPFFVALYQAHKLLRLIDQNKIFSMESIKALQHIKISAIVFSILVVILVIIGVIMIRNIDPREDPPPFPLFGFVLTFISSVIAIFVAVLQKLLTDAVELKSENDLIV